MIRRLAYVGAGRLGLNRAARWAFRNRPLVLCLHGVCAEAPDVPDHAELHVPEALFRRQMEALLRHYTPISLEDLRGGLRGGRDLPASSLLVTFDDGYRNVARHGLPVLRELGVPCAWFVVPGAVEEGRLLWPSELELRFGGEADYPALKKEMQRLSATEREARLRALRDGAWVPPAECDHSLASWNDLTRELQRGGVEVGSHGHRHHPLVTCDPQTLRIELRESAALLERRLGLRVHAIAYPNGAYSAAVREATAEAGYALAFTTDARHGRMQDDALAIPRILVGRRDEVPVLLARVAGWLEWLRALRVGAA